MCVVKPPVTVLNLTRGTSSLFRRVGQNCSSGQRSIAQIDLHCSSFAVALLLWLRLQYCLCAALTILLVFFSDFYICAINSQFCVPCGIHNAHFFTFGNNLGFPKK